MATVVQKKISERKCVGCGEKKPKPTLIRVVRLPEGQGVEIDRTGKKAGRGAYICPSKACLKKARKRLEFSLDCLIPDALFDKLEAEIEEDGK